MKKLFAVIVILCTILILAGCLHDTPGPDQPTVSTGDATEPSYKPHIHQYRITEEHDATCTEDGYNVVACHCGDSYSVTTDLAKGHNLQRKEIVAPTETEGGYTLYVCSRCGFEKRSDETSPLNEIIKNGYLCFRQDSAGKLYYYYQEGENTTPSRLLCDEPVTCYRSDGIFLYFVKETEPMKLYYAPLTNLSIIESIYESDFGPINDIGNYPSVDFQGKILTLTEGNKRGVLLDLQTFEATEIIRQYYLTSVSIYPQKDENGNLVFDYIRFSGKLHEKDHHDDYGYSIKFGFLYDWQDQIVMIHDEPLATSRRLQDKIYFVTEAEPSKLYCAPVENATQRTLLYESTGGATNAVYCYEDAEYACITIDQKQAILLDINTRKTQVFLERPRINRARITDLQIIDGAVKYNVIYFEGKKSADDYGSAYLYYIDTGVYEEVGLGFW